MRCVLREGAKMRRCTLALKIPKDLRMILGVQIPEMCLRQAVCPAKACNDTDAPRTLRRVDSCQAKV